MKVNINLPIETEEVEFKTSLAELNKGLEALAAMLNKQGQGNIYFGVANDGEVIGLKDQLGRETIRKIEIKISQTIKPAIIPTIAVEDYDSKKILHISAKGNRKPYASSGNYRIRVGSSNKKIEPDLLEELFFDSDLNSLQSIESINQNLSFNTLKFHYHESNLTVNENNFYQNAGLLVNGKFNMLADLLADENNTSIKVVRFAGTTKEKMLSRNEYGYKCLLQSMQQAYDYVESLNETKVDTEAGLARKEVKLFDINAFREAWTNACIHNKWVRNVPPAIYIFSDRIEIISTGGLPFNFSEDDFYSGVSHPINPGLFKILGQLNLIEQTGHGNLVIVDKYGKNAFDIHQNFITVKIPFAFSPSMIQTDTAGLSPSQVKILDTIKHNPSIRIKDIVEICQLGTTQVSKIIKSLKQAGKIERVGSNKVGYWKVV